MRLDEPCVKPRQHLMPSCSRTHELLSKRNSPTYPFHTLPPLLHSAALRDHLAKDRWTMLPDIAPSYHDVMVRKGLRQRVMLDRYAAVWIAPLPGVFAVAAIEMFA